MAALPVDPAVDTEEVQSAQQSDTHPSGALAHNAAPAGSADPGGLVPLAPVLPPPPAAGQLPVGSHPSAAVAGSQPLAPIPAGSHPSALVPAGSQPPAPAGSAIVASHPAPPSQTQAPPPVAHPAAAAALAAPAAPGLVAAAVTPVAAPSTSAAAGGPAAVQGQVPLDPVAIAELLRAMGAPPEGMQYLVTRDNQLLVVRAGGAAPSYAAAAAGGDASAETSSQAAGPPAADPAKVRLPPGVRLPTFDGKQLGMPAERFKVKAQNLIALYSLPLLSYGTHLFTGVAQDWFDLLVFKDRTAKSLTWDAVWQAFTARFCIGLDEIEFDQLHKLQLGRVRQAPGQGVREYLNLLHTECALVPDTSERDMIMYFLKGLSSPLRDLCMHPVAGGVWKSLNELVEFTLRQERLLKSADRHPLLPAVKPRRTDKSVSGSQGVPKLAAAAQKRQQSDSAGRPPKRRTTPGPPGSAGPSGSSGPPGPPVAAPVRMWTDYATRPEGLTDKEKAWQAACKAASACYRCGRPYERGHACPVPHRHGRPREYATAAPSDFPALLQRWASRTR